MNGWVWSNCGKVLTVGNGSTVRKTLYSVGGSCRCVWNNVRMVLTVGKWCTGRKTLYSVGCRWMKGYGAMVEWYWQWETDVLGEKDYIVCVVGEWKCMERWWKGTDKGKLKYRDQILYSVCGRWMNGYGAIVEWYWQWEMEVLGGKLYIVWVVVVDAYGTMVELYLQGENDVLGGKHYIVWVVGEWKCLEQWWNGTDSGKRMYRERNII